MTKIQQDWILGQRNLENQEQQTALRRREIKLAEAESAYNIALNEDAQTQQMFNSAAQGLLAFISAIALFFI